MAGTSATESAGQVLGLAWYWADAPGTGSGCGGYAEYYGAPPFPPIYFGESHTAKIVNANAYNGSGWQTYIYRDGTAIGHSGYCHADIVGRGMAGAEIVHNNAGVLASANSL